MNYYMCTMLCTELLNGLAESLRSLEWTAGDQFQLVTVSIDAAEEDVFLVMSSIMCFI